MTDRSILRDLFEIISKDYSTTEEVAKALNVSRVIAKRRLNLAKLIQKYLQRKPKTIEEFRYTLTSILLENLCLRDVFNSLANKLLPPVPFFIVRLLRNFEIKIDEDMARDLIKLAKELEVIAFRRIAIIVESDEDMIREILIRKGKVQFKELKRIFPDARTLIFLLWRRGKVKIPGIEKIGITPKEVEDPDNIPLDAIKEECEFIEFEEDSETNEIRARLVIPDHTVIEFVV